MASDAEPAKLLLPFLQRADELQKHEPLVAYYCRLYAMDRGLKISQKERTKTTNALLVSLMNQLEKDKKTLKLGSEDNLHVEGFASNVFAKADKQDRAGRADLNTAKTFYAASIFFEVLNQFGELAPDIEQKLKYSVWKAADIRKALKEGRRPEPGPPGGDKDLASSSPRANTNVVDSNESIQAKFSGGLSTEQKSEQQFHDLGSGSLNYNGANDLSQPSHKEIKRSDSLNYGGASATSHQPDMGHNESISYSGAYVPSTKISPRAASLPSPYSAGDFAASDYPQSYPNTYLQQSYASYEQQQQQQQQQAFVGQSHHPTDNPYSYPNFQSYPSFQESTFPAVPTQHHSLSNCVAQYGNVSGNQVGSSASLPPAARYKYDSNYQPPAEKIAEAHRAAKFAVGALAFDDVAVAVDFLRQSLELLTNPSADLH